jgi:arylsulfatase A-like enzyme
MRDWTNFLGGYAGEVFTPHMDRLAARGIVFTNAHCASPVCNPSRTAIMTGLMPSTTGVYNNGQWLRPNQPEMMTLPRFFKENGYTVVGSGKSFHHTAGNNPPDQWHAYMSNPWSDFPWARSNKLNYPWIEWEEPPAEYPFSKVEFLRGKDEQDWGVLPKSESEYDDVKIIDYAIDFLKKHKEGPFFLAAGTFRPHLPWYIPKRFHDLYADAVIQLPEVPINDLEDIPPIGLDWAGSGRNEMQATIRDGQWEEAVRCYLASITFADEQVGKLIDALVKSPFEKNTIIMLWSDHGWHFGEKNHWMKSTLWEAATRVPFIIIDPNSDTAGQKSSRSVNLIDVFPTLVELCGLESDISFDGRDLSPLLANPDIAWPYPSVTEFGRGNAAVRDEHWRYIHYSDGEEELYDHKSDPKEWHNLAGDPAYQKIKDELAKSLPSAWARDALPKSAYHFDSDAWTFTNKKTGEIFNGK